MKSLNIDFLLHLTDEPQLISGQEVEQLVKNVITVLRDNRGTGHLPDQQVIVGNRFILAMYALFSDGSVLDIDVDSYDINYIIEENNYMRMGNNRN